jgi:hypothetical protein
MTNAEKAILLIKGNNSDIRLETDGFAWTNLLRVLTRERGGRLGAIQWRH